MLSLEHYSPDFFEDVDDFRAVHGGALRSLIGGNIENAWAVWSGVDSEWFADGPLILQVDGRQVEMAAYQLGFAVTWDAIDRRGPIRWCVGEGEDDGLELSWREQPTALLRSVAGRTIVRMELIECRSTLAGPQRWLFNGIGFRLNRGYLAVYNALDELGLAGEAPCHEAIRTRPL